VRMQNKIAGLLMETGTPFVKEKLHGKKYFADLLQSLEEVPESVKDLLRLSRGAMEMFQATQKRLIQRLLANPNLGQRVERLASIAGVGEITALTWALEIGDPHRFSSSAKAMSYCGLTSALKSSADKQQRGPISKQRNQWLQTALIEAAKLAPRWNPQLAPLWRSPQAGGLSAGRRQERSALPAPSANPRRSCPAARQSRLNKSCGDMGIQQTATGFPHPHSYDCGCEIYCEPVSDPPAVPRHKRDCAEEFLLPMLPPGCFEAGRFTLTQSSRTVLRYCSRKWMSGQAKALVAPRIEDSSPIQTTVPLREPIAPSERRPPSLLDFYLSWMSPFASLLPRHLR
jgi:hypothetical protein